MNRMMTLINPGEMGGVKSDKLLTHPILIIRDWNNTTLTL